MPRRQSRVKRRPTLETAQDIIKTLPDGQKRSLEIILEDFKKIDIGFKSCIQKKIDDHSNNFENIYELLISKCLKSYRNMNFDESVEKNQATTEQPSYITEVDKMVDDVILETSDEEVSPQKLQKHSSETVTRQQKKKCYSVALSKLPSTRKSYRTVQTSGKKKAASEKPRKLKKQFLSVEPQRSKRHLSSKGITPQATATRSVFTPKFDLRQPITPAQGLRQPNVGEKVVLISQDGSPLCHQTDTNAAAAIILPLKDGTSLTISSNTQVGSLRSLDEDTQQKLKLIQKKLAVLNTIPINILN